jgi:hypothetical protein
MADPASLIGVELTGSDMTRLSGAHVVLYGDLPKYASFQDMVGSGAAVLFPIASKKSGHWMGAWQQGDESHIFDPIGMRLDAELRYVAAGERQAVGADQPQFHVLLQRSPPSKVCVSTVHFEKNQPGIETCGRWVVLRLRHKDMEDDAFDHFVQEQIDASGLSPDAWVCTVIH